MSNRIVLQEIKVSVLNLKENREKTE